MNELTEFQIAISRTNWLTNTKATPNNKTMTACLVSKPRPVKVVNEVTPEMLGNTERMREKLGVNPFTMVNLPLS
jgi:hypothetical protein